MQWWKLIFARVRASLGIVQYNSTTSRLQVAGSNIDPYEFTWAQFILLTASNYSGINVRVTDKHQDSLGVGGLLFRGGTSWTLLDPQMYSATLAAAPDPTLFNGLRVFAADVGAVVVSNGTRYRLQSWSTDLVNTLAAIPHPTSPFTSEVILKSVPLPVDVNNKSIVDDGDIIQVVKAWVEKTGVASGMTRRYLLGSSVTVGNYTNAASGEVLSTADASGSTLARADKLFDILRLSATTVQIDGANALTATFSGGGAFTPGHNTTTITTSSFDSATPPSLHFAIKLVGSGDTSPTLRRGYRVKLIRGY